MNSPTGEKLISPSAVLKQVAAAVPEDFRQNIIIVGSLAAGYYFFGDNSRLQVRTKDVDCLLSPRIKDIRLVTSHGHFSLCSFGFLSLAAFQPIATSFGLAIARPETMALANLLHHPAIREQTMSGLIAGRRIKRSNKDLGRVLALAQLAEAREEDTLQKWPAVWAPALQSRFPNSWRKLLP